MTTTTKPDTCQWQLFWQEDSLDVLVWSVASLVCCILLCMLYFFLPAVRRTPGWFLARAAQCELLLSASFLGLYFVEGQNPCFVYGESSNTQKWLLCAVASANIADAWRLAMYVHLVSVYRNPFRLTLRNGKYVLATSGFGIAVAAGCGAKFLAGDKSNPTTVRGIYFDVVAYGLMFVPFTTFFLLGGVLYATVQYLVSISERQRSNTADLLNDGSRPHPSISFLARQRVMLHGLAYWLLQGGIMSLGLLAYFTSNLVRVSPKPFWHILVSLICGRPVFSFIGWSLINDVVYQVFGVCSCNPWRISRLRAARVAARTSQSMASELPTSLLPTVSSQATAAGSDAGTSSMGSAGVPSIGGLMSNLAENGQGIQGNFKEELRFELIYDVARGIGELAQRELHESGTSLNRTLNPIRQKSRTRSVAQRSDSRGSSRLDSPSPVHHQKAQFRKVREAFKIKSETYHKAFPNSFTVLDQNWRKRLKESVSEGASGSFFYRVLNNDGASSRFIVKQVTWSEVQTLLKILPAYTAHVEQSEGRSLIQYFGCHSMSLRWTLAGQVHFVVMQNFLPVRPWLTFDLKGATANRRALAAHVLHHVHAGEDPRGGGKYGTLRDWEWMDIAMFVDVDDAQKKDLFAMIVADADFLSEQGLLDYSLLIGIYRLPQDLGATERQARLQDLVTAGGYVSYDRQKVYFFGIIDILEPYSLRWRAQHSVLSMLYHLKCKGTAADGISAMAPRDYADRFKTFVALEVLQLSLPLDAHQLPVGTCALQNIRRWQRLWQRRRRGLVRDRIECERADHLRRIQELEGELLHRQPVVSPPCLEATC